MSNEAIMKKLDELERRIQALEGGEFTTRIFRARQARLQREMDLFLTRLEAAGQGPPDSDAGIGAPI